MRYPLVPLLLLLLAGCVEDNPDQTTGDVGSDGGITDVSSLDGGSNFDVMKPSCVAPEENEACGLNGRGQRTRTCADGVWTDWGDCDDPDICTDGDEDTDEAACPDGGAIHRSCTTGLWSGWSPCGDPECQPDEAEQRECGLNDRGTEDRQCDNGLWGNWGACTDPDTCLDGAHDVQDCENGNGEQSRECPEGMWTEWTACAPPPACADGDEDSRACGHNGRGLERRACRDGEWGNWSACEDADLCLDGNSRNEVCGLNGRGSRQSTCADGQWGPFGDCQDPDRCVDDREEEQACGNRGAQTRRCDAGRWSNWGECVEQGECMDGAEEARACGINNQGQAIRLCLDGQWDLWSDCRDPDVCRNDAQEQQQCGINNRGLEIRRCAQGQWADWSPCADEDVCEDETRGERACGLNGRGIQRRPCQNGQWRPWRDCNDLDVCTDNDREIEACGQNGEHERVCAQGRWLPFGDCVEPAECMEGAVAAEPCGNNGLRERICVDANWGPWGPCLGDQVDACEVFQHDVQALVDGQQFEFVTLDQLANHNASCGGNQRVLGANGPEAVLRFVLAERSTIEFEVIEANYDTVMHLRSVCADPSTELACDDDSADVNLGSALTGVLPAGEYFLFVDGFGDASGQATVEVRIAQFVCEDGAVDVEACANDGTRRRICADAVWGAWGPCEGASQCIDNPTESDYFRCGEAGVAQNRSCENGEWTDWGVCDGPDFCIRAHEFCRLCWDDFEHNDNRAEATPIAPGQYGSLVVCDILDPVDLYAFDLEIPSYVQLIVQHQDGPIVEITNDQLNPIPGRLVGGNPIQASVIADAGQNYLRIGSVPGIGHPYAMDLEITPVQACEWSPEPCFRCIDRTEPNNGFATATPLNEDEWLEGMGICANLNRLDMYLFRSRGGAHRIQIEPGPDYLGTIDVRLLRSNGTEIPSQVEIRNDGERRIELEVDGEVYIEVSTLDGAGEYRIRYQER